jgi:hypothetical protein
MNDIKCLRCDVPMEFLMRESFQKGACGAWVGNLNFNFRGGYEMEVYRCPRCGKLEFFEPDWQDKTEETDEFSQDVSPLEAGQITRVNMDGIPQVRCRCCGQEHDFDYPACPHCGHQNNM